MTRRSLLHALYRNMSSARRRQLLALLGMMLACALAEALMIGATLPFLALLADPSGATLPVQVSEALAAAGANPLVLAALLLTGSALLLAVLRLGLLWHQQRFAMRYGHELGGFVFARMLRQPYLAHLSRNSSEMLAGMEKAERIVLALLQPALQGLVAVVLSLFVMATLLLVDAVAATIAAIVTAGAYAAVTLITRRRLLSNSKIIAGAITARNQTVREALGGIRDVLLDGSQGLHEAKYAEVDTRNRRAQAENVFMGQAPRYVVEAVGVIALSAVALLVSRGEGGFAEAVPVLGALALGAQRLLPLLQQGWAGYSQFTSHQQWLRDVVALMELPIEEESGPAPLPLPLRGELRVDHLSFAYRPDRPVIDDLSCSIKAGERVGLAGPTGSGKSTLADLLMGLIEPTGGRILIDGQPLTRHLRRAWQANIAHVPQTIYLTDDSIRANIALGVPRQQVDEERLAEVARAAQLDRFIGSLPEGWDTRVGERGVQLSGGQRQRIGLARALYKQANVLVLDEATNALDQLTEAAVLRAIGELDRRMTVIMIAHRPAALELCDRVISLGQRLPHESPQLAR